VNVRFAVTEDLRISLEVTDNGCGMTGDVIRNYFLVAGASLGREEHWAERFVNSEGQSQLQRCGYFGIGSFAGFLAHSSYRVGTRSMDRSAGVEFSVERFGGDICLWKVDRPVGTTVTFPDLPALREKVLPGARRRRSEGFVAELVAA
jgi:HSP90 family molecular chaperone